jgi:prophage antirepressor-like protein
MQHIPQQHPAGKAMSPFEYVSKGPAVPGASRLVSLPYLSGAQIRAYRDLKGIAWFVLADVYRAISAKNPGNMRKRVKTPEDLTEVKAWVANSVYPEASGFRFITAMSEGGMNVMLGISKQEPSIALRKWMIEVAVPSLRTV